ncbi:Trafficking protein particle complex subunit 23 [Komagataella phaffii CBS 7435]|uniref:Trafficking protein particle complex subunit n=2 Tax=Komagataella phaffii TaxID=460519 RepID=C4R2L6_KOMPG|nr:One of 10 subunits of the transport protein particle (TRAPP) complex of the cis-Golgi [Komagataella phaffii GS115]AOA61982.1 GQ67_01159T0 [Komagataella phaffii]CAH2447705.1 Trafficking protein particle complex subunit 23 [Komagataella phaffii CBS 7435]AOA68058.1 GQ68_00230T0 [Komagataella phaffii GS115]CAY69740.1 One of 10 subunits of the transport protein particle (TRAPP) complex of the cis-Golgi [Komagataella phaffii GS115]CCA37886.1 Trafficking protein particle complex subunit 23 [Komaga
MKVLSLYLLNKSGGLIYQRDFNPESNGINKLSSNDYLITAGTLHSIHAIVAGLTPPVLYPIQENQTGNQNQTGLFQVETEKFNLFIYQTLTGLKIISIVQKGVSQETATRFMANVHSIYSDYVMKNPFYTLDMPIKCQLFSNKVLLLSEAS